MSDGSPVPVGTDRREPVVDTPLSPHVVALWRAGWVITTAILLVPALLVGVAATDLPMAVRIGLPLAVTIIGITLAVVVPNASYRNWRYAVTEDGVELRHGVFIRHESSIPHFRVQHIDIGQGPLDRWRGIVKLSISTASPSSDGSLPGIEPTGPRSCVLASWRGPRPMTGSDPGGSEAPLAPPPPTPTGPVVPASPGAAPPPPGLPPPGGPIGPKRLHPSSPILGLILSARQWLFPLLVFVIASEQRLIIGPGVVVVLALLVGWLFLSWSRFTYELRDGVLIIDRGVFNRHHREVPIARIQQVDLRRKLRHRVLNVAVVRIDTASGGNDAEVVLEAIAEDQALALRVALLARAGVPAPAGPVTDGPASADPAALEAPMPAPPTRPVEVVRLSLTDLVVAGLTGSRLAAALPFAAAGFGLLADLPDDASDQVLGLAPSGTLALVLLAIAIVPVILLAAVAQSILTDHAFTIVRIGTDLHVRRGLLDQREATVSMHRVQAVRVRENLLRRKLGIAAVELQSAGSGQQAEGDVTRLTIPYARVAQLAELLPELLPVAVDHPPLIPGPPAARRRAWFRHLAPAVLILVPLAVWASVTTTSWAAIVLVLIVPFGVAAEMAYRNLGHVGTPSLVVATHGTYERVTELLPVSKTQSTTITSSPFQRRSGLATLHVQVAGRGATPRITDGAADLLARLRIDALRASAARADEHDVRTRVRSEAG
ncbi:PH domain-containing protein [Aquihabitans daechungensis]|uniref:PH domain-containing protein n=1 Tax=Aquihabitans daechungensis TaxID=1052257 RepID=UPI003B9FFFE7